jgi:hypothetical protein
MATPPLSRLGGGPLDKVMALHQLLDLPWILPVGRLAGSRLLVTLLVAAIP